MIVVELRGGLGNQLFQYALGRFLAERHQTQLLLDTAFLLDRSGRERGGVFRDYELNRFALRPAFAGPDLSRRYGLGSTRLGRAARRLRRLVAGCRGPLTYVAEQTPFRAEARVLHAPDDCYLSGYWQTRRYVEPVAALLRRELAFREPLPEPLQPLARRMKTTESVCVHVRRGDVTGSRRHDVVSPAYYARAADELRRRLGKPTFFVFSDEPGWCRRHLALRGGVEWMDEPAGLPASWHFQLMSGCRHFVIPNSTFAWWAAFLGADDASWVVAPRVWLYDGRRPVVAADLKYPNWIQL